MFAADGLKTTTFSSSMRCDRNKVKLAHIAIGIIYHNTFEQKLAHRVGDLYEYNDHEVKLDCYSTSWNNSKLFLAVISDVRDPKFFTTLNEIQLVYAFYSSVLLIKR